MPSPVKIGSEYKSHLIVMFVKDSTAVKTPKAYNKRLPETFLCFLIIKTKPIVIIIQPNDFSQTSLPHAGTQRNKNLLGYFEFANGISLGAS